MEGRWFTGGYDEIGIDVKLERVGAETRVLGTDRTALKQGAPAQELKIYGANLARRCGPPMSISAPASRCRASSVRRRMSRPSRSTSPRPRRAGARDLFVAGASRPKALAVYDKIDTIKVKPDWAMARVGGDTFPKMLAQFEAWGYSNGADGKPDSPDDIELGIVDAAWSMEEYAATYNDDDIKFVGDVERGDRPLHAERRRPESRAQRISATTSATSGWWRKCSVTRSAASRRRRCGRARICWSPCRSTCVSIRRGHNEQHLRCASFIRSKPPAAGSSIWCRARRCSRSTTVRRRCSIRSPTARGRSTT